MTTLEVPSGTARLACEVTGAGERVVLVHAGITDSRMWDPLLAHLGTERRVVRYDLRGYGRSPLQAGPFRHVDDLAAVLATTGEGPAHLVGASLGARVALDLAVTRPDAVQSLVLLGAVVSGCDPDAPMPPLWDDVVAAGRADDIDAQADAEARMWLADPDGTRLPDVVDLVRAMNRTALANERATQADDVAIEPPAAGRLDDVAVPVLVVDGDLDLPVIGLTADLLAERLPRAERVRMAGVAHLPALERPEEVAALVRDFHARVGQGP